MAEVIKVRIKYEKGSQTLNQCDPLASDANLFAAAQAISSLTSHKVLDFTKIAESELLRG